MDILSILPTQASNFAMEIDLLYFVLWATTIFFVILIAGLIVFFAVRYHKDNKVNRVRSDAADLFLEIFWTVIPTIFVMVIFLWGAKIYYDVYTPPKNTLPIYVVGKQWMWKIEHPEGQQEINTLHLPVGRAIEIIGTSQDVLHSFYIPAFRVKKDVIPGRYTRMWFIPTKVGEYHLFCAEFCGNLHAGMIGKVIVMEEQDYQTWLRSGGIAGVVPPGAQAAGAAPATATAAGGSMAAKGKALFEKYACKTCHSSTAPANRAPSFKGLFGHEVELEGGAKVTVDETYITESILNPAAKVVKGYMPIMPPYQGQINESEINQLIEYIKNYEE